MLNTLLLLLLAAALFISPAILMRCAERLRWRTRYLLALLPVAYTGIGWCLGTWGYGYFGCQGGVKNLHGCLAAAVDVTALVGHGFFLMIPGLFIAAPLSAWFLLDTALKQIGAWNKGAGRHS